MSQVAHTDDKRSGDGADSSPSLVQRAITKNTWRLVPVLALAYLFNYLDRTSVGYCGSGTTR